MNLLNFDEKRGNSNKNLATICYFREDLTELLGVEEISGYLICGTVNILDQRVSRILYEGGFGKWIDDNRDDRINVSKRCFRTEIDTKGIVFQDVEAEQKWKDLNPSTNILLLSSEEVLFLVYEWNILKILIGNKPIDKSNVWEIMIDCNGNRFELLKSVCTYRYLKRNKWIVRSGLTFGCHFLIYHMGPEFYHASAGILISNKIEPLRLLGLTRILSHNRKALIMVTCKLPENCQGTSWDDVNLVEIKTVTMKTYFLDRDVARISNRQNDLYEKISETITD